jgi:LysM repeat protein
VQAAEDWRRFVAPAAFLLAVTVAVVLVRAGLEHGTPTRTASAPSGGETVAVTSTVAGRTVTRASKVYWTVKAGDTFGVISDKTGVPVATIERLNPGKSSTSLFIGERIRVK